jgi:hypothetical protein
VPNISRIIGQYGATAATLGDPTHFINTEYRRKGRPVWISDRNLMALPSGNQPTDGWTLMARIDGTATATEMRDAQAALNTTGKTEGKLIRVLPRNYSVVASGNGAYDGWESGPGQIAYRPGLSSRGAGFTWRQRGTSRIFYVTAAAGGTAFAIKPAQVIAGNAALLTEAVNLAELVEGRWFWGDADGLGFPTVYVQLPTGPEFPDPNPAAAVYYDGFVRSRL